MYSYLQDCQTVHVCRCSEFARHISTRQIDDLGGGIWTWLLSLFLSTQSPDAKFCSLGRCPTRSQPLHQRIPHVRWHNVYYIFLTTREGERAKEVPKYHYPQHVWRLLPLLCVALVTSEGLGSSIHFPSSNSWKKHAFSAFLKVISQQLHSLTSLPYLQKPLKNGGWSTTFLSGWKLFSCSHVRLKNCMNFLLFELSHHV